MWWIITKSYWNSVRKLALVCSPMLVCFWWVQNKSYWLGDSPPARPVDYNPNILISKKTFKLKIYEICQILKMLSIFGRLQFVFRQVNLDPNSSCTLQKYCNFYNIPYSFLTSRLLFNIECSPNDSVWALYKIK